MCFHKVIEEIECFFFKLTLSLFEGFLTVKMFNQSINGQLSQL